MPFCRSLSMCVYAVTALAQLRAQEPAAPVQPSAVLPQTALPWAFPGLHPSLPSCDAIEIAAAKTLTLHQRACYYGNKLVSPSGVAHAAFSSAYSQWRNAPYVHHQDMDDFGQRFATFYARRAARDAGELIAGYLNHEDPRPRLSNKSGFWNRTGSALRSAVLVGDESGPTRPALSPLAGAFASGFVSANWYRNHNVAEEGLKRSGISYSAYFGSAVLREFKPDLAAFGSRLLHRR